MQQTMIKQISNLLINHFITDKKNMYHWSIVYKPWCKTGCLPYQHVTNHIAQINHTSFNQLIECSSLALRGQAGSWNLLRAGRLKLCICPWHLWQVVVLFFCGFTFFLGDTCNCCSFGRLSFWAFDALRPLFWAQSCVVQLRSQGSVWK